MKIVEKARALWAYVWDRLDERSTWTDIAVAVSAAAVLPWPYSAVAIVIGIIKTMVPDGRGVVKK